MSVSRPADPVYSGTAPVRIIPRMTRLVIQSFKWSGKRLFANTGRKR